MIHLIENCPRCGKNHGKCVLKQLAKQHGNGGWSHWCMCPVTEEPILVAVGGGTTDVAPMVVNNKWVNPLDEIEKIMINDHVAPSDRLRQIGAIIKAHRA